MVLTVFLSLCLYSWGTVWTQHWVRSEASWCWLCFCLSVCAAWGTVWTQHWVRCEASWCWLCFCLSVCVAWAQSEHSTGLGARHHGVDCVSVSLSVRLRHSLHHSTGLGARCIMVLTVFLSLVCVQLEHSLNHSTGLGARHPGVDCVSVSLSVRLEHSLNHSTGLVRDTMVLTVFLELWSCVEHSQLTTALGLPGWRTSAPSPGVVQKLQAKVLTVSTSLCTVEHFRNHSTGPGARHPGVDCVSESLGAAGAQSEGRQWAGRRHHLQVPSAAEPGAEAEAGRGARQLQAQAAGLPGRTAAPSPAGPETAGQGGCIYKIQMIETFERMILGTTTKSKWLKLSEEWYWVHLQDPND